MSAEAKMDVQELTDQSKQHSQQAQQIDLGSETSLVLEDVAAVAQGARVSFPESAGQRVQQARTVVETKAAQDEATYGINTGFGALVDVKIPRSQVHDLQRNLILSHCVGVGKPLGKEETRAIMFLRAQTLAKGFSGVRPCVIELLVAMLNEHIHSHIPEKGSVGASGDLAPLAHLALATIGEGQVEHNGKQTDAREALREANLEPIVLAAKEGLALVNGTQAMAALGCLNIFRAERLAELAGIAGAMSIEGTSGSTAAFDERIHDVRPHSGQCTVAAHIRSLLFESGTYESQRQNVKVQDPYSLRCIPQVHGATRDALKYARNVLEVEINSVTDNPLVFADTEEILSGGNFHGQPLALAMDFAAIALSELANISERRIDQLCNPASTKSDLPPFLIEDNGICSGYMMAQVTPASLVNENKSLCTPASADSIPGSANREDHVSMGMTSARQLREIVPNVSIVLAIELLCAAQAIDLRERPGRLGVGVEAAHKLIRSHVPHLDSDRVLSQDIEVMASLVKNDLVQGAASEAVVE